MEAALNGPNGRIVLGATPLTIGRTPDNQLIVNDAKASSHHAEIRPDDQGYSITDLGSTNGTFVNGQRLIPHMGRHLNNGDAIRIGDTQYNYEGAGGSSSSQYASTVYAGPGQSGGFDQTIPAAPPPAQPQSTAYGANAAPGYQPPSSSPNYPPYGAGTPSQPSPAPYQAPGAQPAYPSAQPPYQAPGASSPYPGAQPAYPQQQSYIPPSVPSGYQAQPSYPPPMSQSAPGAALPGYSPVPPQTPQAPQQPKRRPVGMIVLIVAVVIILIGGSAGFFVIHNNQVKIDNQHATATAVQGSHLTATAQVFATQTAIVNAQATATASVIAANPDPYPPNTGKLALIDPLKDNTAGNKWTETSGSGGSCGFNGGAYHVSDTTVNYFVYCVSENTNFSNFAYQVTMTIDKGDCGGIVFRVNLSTNSFYHFVVCDNGLMLLSVYSNNNGTVLIHAKASSAVQTGLNVQNTVGVVAQGSSINLFINNQNVGSVTDNTQAAGSIGVIAEAVNNASDAVYSNAKVWQL